MNETNETAKLATTLRMLVALLREKADNHRTTGALWKTNPSEYGTDAEGIADWEGRGLGFKDAADLVESVIPK